MIDLYCTGSIYRKSVGKYVYFTLSHAGQDYCPLHEDFNSVQLDPKSLGAIELAIGANPDPNRKIFIYDDTLKVERPPALITIGLLVSWFSLFIPLWYVVVVGIIGVIAFSHSVSFWLYTNYVAEDIKNIERVVLKRQFKIEENNRKRYRVKVWFAANWSIKRAVSYNLMRIGFAHVTAQSNQGGIITGGGGTRSPKLSRPVIGQDSVLYKVLRMPYRSLMIDLLDKKIERELSTSMAREVICHERPDGVYIEVMFKTGAGGIKRTFSWDDPATEYCVTHMLPKSAPRLAIPFGLGRGRRFHYGDLTSTLINHMLIAGSTGGGKSNYINQLICTWIKNNDARRLHLYLIDLKRVEFVDYAKLKHLKRPIVTDREDAQPVLDEIFVEIERRSKMFQGTARNIKEWNKRNRINGLPYIVLVIDELAELSHIPNWKQKGEPKLMQIIQLGRAMGVHVILATQIIKSSILGTIATANIPCRVCFPVGSINGSMLIVETKAAYDLPRIPGRAVFVQGPERKEVQTPYISPKQIQDTVQFAIDRDSQIDNLDEKATNKPDILELMLNHALDNDYILPAIKDGTISEYGYTKKLKEVKYIPGKNELILSDERIGEYVIISSKGLRVVVSPLSIQPPPSDKAQIHSMVEAIIERASRQVRE